MPTRSWLPCLDAVHGYKDGCLRYGDNSQQPAYAPNSMDGPAPDPRYEEAAGLSAATSAAPYDPRSADDDQRQPRRPA